MNPVFMKMISTSRRLISLFLLLLTGVLLTSCGSPKSETTPQTIALDILNASSFSKMVNVTSDQLGTHLSIAPSLLKDYMFYISSAEGNADEIGIFRAVDEASVVHVKTAVSEHLMQMEKRFSDLDQTESDKIKKCIFAEYRQWVFLVITSNPEKAKEVLTRYFPNIVLNG